MIADMRTKYSLRDLYDILEVLDAHDDLKKIAYERAQVEIQNK